MTDFKCPVCKCEFGIKNHYYKIAVVCPYCTMIQINKDSSYIVKPSDVMALRDITGRGILECKKALMYSDGDFDKAKEWIKENKW